MWRIQPSPRHTVGAQKALVIAVSQGLTRRPNQEAQSIQIRSKAYIFITTLYGLLLLTNFMRPSLMDPKFCVCSFCCGICADFCQQGVCGNYWPMQEAEGEEGETALLFWSSFYLNQPPFQTPSPVTCNRKRASEAQAITHNSSPFSQSATCLSHLAFLSLSFSIWKIVMIIASTSKNCFCGGDERAREKKQISIKYVTLPGT